MGALLLITIEAVPIAPLMFFYSSGSLVQDPTLCLFVVSLYFPPLFVLPQSVFIFHAPDAFEEY